MKMAEEKEVAPPAPQYYTLELSDNDKIAILNIINQTTFKGADCTYVVGLIDRVSNAPLSANNPPPNSGGQAK